MKNVNVLLIGLALSACSSGGGDNSNEQPKPPPAKLLPISISTTVGGITDTRATEYGFESGDIAGLYVVNRSTTGTSGTLKPQGNHVDNMKFTYTGTWTPATPVYWNDVGTHADFYFYYPYVGAVASVEAMPFSVKADQSSLAAYKSGDMIVGSAMNVAPTENAVGISARHIMSQAVINLAAGNGFTGESIAAASVKISINGIKNQGNVNIADGTIVATGTATSIIPLNDNGSYKALIIPQTVGEGNLITVTVDGKDFNFAKAFTFEGGKRHRFTITLSKTNSGINVSINPWEDDGTDNGGTAE